jgi:hypothetical protein
MQKGDWVNFDIDSEILDIAIQHYGKPTQVLKLVEELQELTEVMCSMLVGESVADTNAIYEMSRRIRANLDSMPGIKPKILEMSPEKAFKTSDEIADSLLMIFQAVKIFDCRQQTQKRIFAKESRLLDRMEGDET